MQILGWWSKPFCSWPITMVPDLVAKVYSWDALCTVVLRGSGRIGDDSLESVSAEKDDVSLETRRFKSFGRFATSRAPTFFVFFPFLADDFFCTAAHTLSPLFSDSISCCRCSAHTLLYAARA